MKVLTLYDRKQIDRNRLLFTDKSIWLLLLPIILEQFLNTFMGMADTVMVSNVGEVAVSAVSLVDSINNLIIQVFSAMAAGATIVCSQQIGKGDLPGANDTARQVFLSLLVISSVLLGVCVWIKRPLLALVFGAIDDDVMQEALKYFTITAISYPFLALTNAGGSLFRASGNTRFPMIVSVASNAVNVAGNAYLIFVLKMGVVGAALATLFSRVVNTVVLYIALSRDRQAITLNHYLKIRPNFALIGTILAIGIPSGIENGMFQFGKLAIQSTVSTLGTTAMSAQAIAIVLELLSAYGGMGVTIGIMTIVGQTIGAGRREEAKYYIVRLCLFGEIAIAFSCLLVFALSKPIIALAGLEGASAALCYDIIRFLTVTKILFWIPSFCISSGMRAAGDVRFSMTVSTLTMWLCRVALSVILVRVFHMGLIAVWIGMSADWLVRGIVFFRRFLGGKWLKKAVV